MYADNIKIVEPIRIIIDKNNKIKNSSVDEKSAYRYLENLNILNLYSDDRAIKENLNNYLVTIDKVILSEEEYSIITINSACERKCCLALIDKATNLYNRNFFEQIAEEAENDDKLRLSGIIMIDIDNLKAINDKNGHLEGDRVIKLVGEAIKRSLRKYDIAIRYGGDEFIILLLNQDSKTINRIAERIRKEVKKLNSYQTSNISVSIGIARDDNFGNLKDLIKIADKKLYKEKEKKRTLEQIEVAKIVNLKQEIERLREELNSNTIENIKNLNNKETIELSQKLDILIANYCNNV